MPSHRIEVQQPAKLALNSDVKFRVYSDGQHLGELKISRGSIDWRPAGRQKSFRRRWEWFAKVMEDGPRGR